MSRPNKSHCPISFALDIFGDKWTLLILRDMIFKDKKYYNDFAKSEEAISTNILADRLDMLTSEGLIKKTKDKENKRKIIYYPTAKALDLIPTILEIIDWSARHDPNTAAPKEFIRMLKKHRKSLARQIRLKFEK